MYRYRIYGKEQRDSYRFVLQKGSIVDGWNDILNILTSDISVLQFLTSNFLGVDFNENLIDNDWVEYEN